MFIAILIFMLAYLNLCLSCCNSGLSSSSLHVENMRTRGGSQMSEDNYYIIRVQGGNCLSWKKSGYTYWLTFQPEAEGCKLFQLKNKEEGVAIQTVNENNEAIYIDKETGWFGHGNGRFLTATSNNIKYAFAFEFREKQFKNQYSVAFVSSGCATLAFGDDNYVGINGIDCDTLSGITFAFKRVNYLGIGTSI